MSDFIPTINWTDFQKVAKQGQLGRLKSCEVNFNGEYLFTFANGNLEPSGYLRTQTEYNCMNANAGVGETLEQILELVEV